MKIEEIDKNFKSENSVNEVNSVYLSVKNAHFELYGFARKEKFLRIPQEVANRVNPELQGSDRIPQAASPL